MISSDGIFQATCIIATAIGGATILATYIGGRQSRIVEQRLRGLLQVRNGAPKSRTRYEAIIRTINRLSLALSNDLHLMTVIVQVAGFSDQRTVYLFIAIRAVLTVLLALLAAAISAFLAMPVIYFALITVAAAGVGYLGPTYALRIVASRRRRRIARELPLFLDSLGLLLQSGASIEIALRHIARMETAIIPEIQKSLRLLEEDLDQGKAYAASFERWGARLSIPDARDVVGLLLQSLQYGGEILPLLKQLVNEIIERRLSDARLAAGKRSVFLTLIMVAFFLPPLVLIISGPAVTSIVRTLRELTPG